MCKLKKNCNLEATPIHKQLSNHHFLLLPAELHFALSTMKLCMHFFYNIPYCFAGVIIIYAHAVYFHVFFPSRMWFPLEQEFYTIVILTSGVLNTCHNRLIILLENEWIKI